MKLTVDTETDALYFRLDESNIIESEEVSPGVILDFNGGGDDVGVEILNVSTRVAAEFRDAYVRVFVDRRGEMKASHIRRLNKAVKVVGNKN
jgi:uncharacterized protein YuzE